MTGDSFFPFLLLLGVFLLFFLRKQRKNQEKKERPIPFKREKSKSYPPKKQVYQEPVFKEERKVSRYEVEKKTKKPSLSKNWQNNSSLKQAFILSEVLKKVDEREFF